MSMKLFTNFRSQRIHLSTCSNFTRGQTHRYILWLNKPPRRHRMIVWSHWKKTLSSLSAAATFLSRNVKAAVAGRSRCKFLRRNTSRLRRYQWERERDSDGFYVDELIDLALYAEKSEDDATATLSIYLNILLFFSRALCHFSSFRT